jgi:Tol biopolymer transport system component/DNA-binding winged helix-turn-helix (wHTH) protein
VSTQAKATVFQFGPFELDPTQQELRRKGVRLRVPGSRLRLLHLLVGHAGQLISRDEIAAALWKDTQTVDVVSGINTAVNQLRAQLGDDPASPKYIETVIGAGYRFVAEVVEIESPSENGVLHSLPFEMAASEASSLPAAVDAPPLQSHRASGLDFTGRKKWLLAVLTAAIVLAAVPYGFLRFSTMRQTSPPAELNMVRVTGDGDIQYADISPNGKYVAYVREQGGEQSLWLKQLATGRVLKLVAMGKLSCQGIAFSPDSDYVYFMRKAPLEPSGQLYRVPFLGGTPTQILTGISGAPAISPDGRMLAFVRSTLITHGEDSIVTASIDGAGERVLASFHAPGIHMNRIAWTADGEALVFPLRSDLYTIAAEGGTAQPVKNGNWVTIDDLRSLPSSDDLLVVGLLPGFSHPQIYKVTLSSGKTEAITHDLSKYTAVRATGDGRSLLAVQDLLLDSIQLLDAGKGMQIRSLSSENQNHDGIDGLAWTPDGKIIYSSQAEDHVELMEANQDGSDPQRIATTDVNHQISDLAVSPRGDYIAAARWGANDVANVWRTDMNGAHAKQLTTGRQDFPLSITPDGNWIVYSSSQGDQSVLMKAPSEGGQPVQLTDYNADDPDVSPDGKWIACSYIPRENQRVRLAIVPIEGGAPAKVFELPENATPRYLAWAPNGRGITFIHHGSDADNIWEQPLDGGPATPVTYFASGVIFNFQWSRDGRLAVAHGTESIDAVLIRNFRDVNR